MRKTKQIFTFPWYPWYVNDVQTSERVKLLNLAEEGAYRRALDSAWKEGSIPSNPADCAKVIGNGCTPKIAKKVLETFFVPAKKDPSRMINKKLETIREEQFEKHMKNVAKGSKGAENRWRKKRDKKVQKNSQNGTNFVPENSENVPDLYQENTKNGVTVSESMSSGDSPTNSRTIAEGMPKQWHSESESESDSSSYEEDFKTIESVGLPPVREIYVGTLTAEITKRLDVKSLPSKLQWQNGMEWAFSNGFTSDQFLETYDLLKSQNWRDGPVKPNHVVDNLPNLEKLRKEIAKQNETQNRQTVKTRGGSPKPDERSTKSVLESIGVFDD